MDELKITEFEQGYLMAFHHFTILPAFADGDGDDWFGILVGSRMFDVNAFVDDETAERFYVVYECYQNDSGEWLTDTSKKWMGLN